MLVINLNIVSLNSLYYFISNKTIYIFITKIISLIQAIIVIRLD
jgi:hypothetical protein